MIPGRHMWLVSSDYSLDLVTIVRIKRPRRQSDHLAAEVDLPSGKRVWVSLGRLRITRAAAIEAALVTARTRERIAHDELRAVIARRASAAAAIDVLTQMHGAELQEVTSCVAH